MGRFVLLGSSVLFIGLSDASNLKYSWPALGLSFLIIDLFWRPLLSVGLALQVAAWTFVGQWPFSAAMLLLYLLHRQSIKQQYARIDESGILLSFPWKRQITWEAVEFIVLKDGLLTIEYKNGRVLQQPILKDPVWNEADFNEFCKQQCKH